jgi:ankyrin repeat protein
MKELLVGNLLERGTNLETTDTEYGRTPLSRAAENGQEAVMKLLANGG